jgi:hypothetical protein
MVQTHNEDGTPENVKNDYVEKEAWIVWNSDKLQDVVKSQGVPSKTHELCVDVA